MLEITQLLERIDRGETAAAGQLLPLIYDELRKLADAKLRCEQPGQTLDATAFVHEVYLRMNGDQQFANRGHFFAAAAEAMRRGDRVGESASFGSLRPKRRSCFACLTCKSR